MFLDSTKAINRVIGFFDGEKFYVDVKKGIDLRRRQLFLPVDYIGRFSFIEFNTKKPIALLSLLTFYSHDNNINYSHASLCTVYLL